METNLSVIIVAGGSGRRMGAEVPKQFLLTKGRPVLMWTIEAFRGAMERIVVLPAEHRGHWLELCKKYNFNVEHKLVTGGDERYESVSKGLVAVDERATYIAVHDGVRPWVGTEVIERVLNGAKEYGSAIPVIRVTDTVRIMRENGESCVLERGLLRAVQTPQIFERSILIHSYLILDKNMSVTDDASVVEAAGYKVCLVEGDATNIKITYPRDL